MPTMRIKRDVTITWEMSEDIAETIIEILEEHNCQGKRNKENAITLSLDALYAALPKVNQRNKSE